VGVNKILEIIHRSTHPAPFLQIEARNLSTPALKSHFQESFINLKSF